MVSSLLSALVGASLLVSGLVGASPAARRGTCTTNQRKAWSALNDDEKAEYLQAEQCLMAAAPKLGIEGAQNRWDELQYGHIVQSNVIHDVGAFLPWHRLYMRAHEILLQDECGYTGAQPYWDELSDAESAPLNESSVFDPDTGFGSELDEDGCVINGPFANTTLHISQTSNYDSYCLSRDLNQDGFYWANSTYLDECYTTTNYSAAWQCFISHPHTAGHAAVGGTMLDVVASPGDPLFFLHHTNLDRLWWIWQQQDLDTRLTDMGDRNVPLYSYLEGNNFSYPGPEILNYDGDPGNTTTLNHNLWMVGLIDNATIADVMDLSGSLICAEYI